jgi:hypothetical protein
MDLSVSVPTNQGTFEKRTGKTAFVNPLRYGATTFFDYARYRLSVFSKEESRAMVSYLKWRQGSEPDSFQNEEIEAALNLFWNDRAENAPVLADLDAHIKHESELTSALESGLDLERSS